MPVSCPTCRKPNCGNHAACARRRKSRCSRCLRSPCYNAIECAAAAEMWQGIAYIEAHVHRHMDQLIAELGQPSGDAWWGAVRKAMMKTLVEIIHEENQKQAAKDAAMLSSLLFMGRLK